MMNLQLLRNATLILTVNGEKVLVDPMLAPQGTYDPFPHTSSTLRNPLVNLPVTDKELQIILSDIDAVLLTHLHLDHWDKAAQEMLSKQLLVLCQPKDADAIYQAGFTNVQSIQQTFTWNDISINRTSGQHGTGAIGKRMGTVSGYAISYENETIYIAGDTIWCDEVKSAINQYKPQHIIVNGGAARFVTGDAIVMDINDIVAVCHYATDAKVYVVHLEAVNHATESRADIKTAIIENKLSDRCFVPNDGDSFINLCCYDQ